MFGELGGNGLWPSGQPIFTTRGRGNDVGNAFVFSPDLLASLIETLPPEVRTFQVSARSRQALG